MGFIAFASLEVQGHDGCVINRMEVLYGCGAYLQFFFDTVARYGTILSKYYEFSGEVLVVVPCVYGRSAGAGVWGGNYICMWRRLPHHPSTVVVGWSEIVSLALRCR